MPSSISLSILTSYSTEAETFLTSDQSLSYSRISQYFMELKSLLASSQEPITGP
jgi:hypothetical protein